MSTNKGQSWKTLTNDLPGSTYSVGLSNDAIPTVYFGGTGSIIHRIDDPINATAGDEVGIYTNSPTLFKGSTIACIKVDPTNKGIIYVGMSNISNRSRIWKLTNADTDQPTYIDISANLPQSLPVNWIEVDPDNPDFIIIATDYGLYTSNNGGGWWEKETRFPNVNIYNLRLRHSDRRLYVFTHGRGAWTADLAQNPTASVQTEKPVQINIWPNPAASVLNVSGLEIEKMSLYDSKGAVLKTGTTDFINVADIKAGIYFLEVHHANGTTVKKVIIER
jgi:hypothetical protein